MKMPTRQQVIPLGLSIHTPGAHTACSESALLQAAAGWRSTGAARRRVRCSPKTRQQEPKRRTAYRYRVTTHEWLQTVLTTAGPLGFILALTSLLVSIGNLRRLLAQERRLARAKVGVKLIGVNNVQQGEPPALDIYQVRVAGADGLVVSGAGIAVRSRWTLRWKYYRQDGAGLLRANNTEVKNWLPHAIKGGDQALVGIPAQEPDLGFWKTCRDKRRQVRCWVEIGNHWIVDTKTVIVQDLEKTYR